jgi:hypothetical protein
VITVLVILSTANHYVLDAVAGAVVIVVTMSASWRAHRHLLLKKESELIREAGHKLTTPASIEEVPNACV